LATLGLSWLFLNLVMSKETIRVTPESIVHEISIPLHTSRKEYDTLIVSDLHAIDVPKNDDSLTQSIHFNYAGKPRSIGRSFSYDEALEIGRAHV